MSDKDEYVYVTFWEAFLFQAEILLYMLDLIFIFLVFASFPFLDEPFKTLGIIAGLCSLPYALLCFYFRLWLPDRLPLGPLALDPQVRVYSFMNRKADFVIRSVMYLVFMVGSLLSQTLFLAGMYGLFLLTML